MSIGPSNVVSHLKDVAVFFWPPVVACAIIGYLAAQRKRRATGFSIGLLGGVVLALVLTFMAQQR